MKKIVFKPKLKLNEKHLVAVSGGPDSMALLDLLRSQGYKLEVAHINYLQRKSAKRDQKIVEEYCKKYNLKYHIKTNDQKPSGNFQDWARNYRYNFFKEIYSKGNFDALLVAHHQDDKIETYLIKKSRPAIYNHPAISPISKILNMKVIRPLLNYSKKELIDYCTQRNVNFGIDETNKSEKYLRNKIRNKTLNELNEKQRKNLLVDIKKAELENQKNNAKFDRNYKKIVDKNIIDLKLLQGLSSDNKVRSLYRFIIENTTTNPKNLSARRINDYLKQLETKKPSLLIKVGNGFALSKSYNDLKIANEYTQKFIFKINKIEFRDYQDFKIMKTGASLEGVHVVKSDLPLTIRSYHPSDTVEIKQGHKKVSRLFIDNKVPLQDRNLVPIVLNSKNEVLLVSKYYVKPDRKRLQSNLFVVKY